MHMPEIALYSVAVGLMIGSLIAISITSGILADATKGCDKCAVAFVGANVNSSWRGSIDTCY